MRGSLIVAAIAILVVGCAETRAIAPTAPPTVDVTGHWTGVCFGCLATGFTLVTKQEGSDVKGTVVAAGRHDFGSNEKPLLDGRVAGNRLTFRVKGDPGDFWDVDLAVKGDGKTMEGSGYYRGPFTLRFTRAPQ